MRLPLLCLFVVLLLGPVRGAEPFFKKGDVIALVGGEDMVVASEYGYLELLLTRALPDYHLRFRNLAWEGDTVFEQRRDLNFPSYEEQLDKIGATVVIAQFGQMEAIAGKFNDARSYDEAEPIKRTEIAQFSVAYKKLVERFSAGGKRRVLILGVKEPGQEFVKYADIEWIAGILDVANKSGAEYARIDLYHHIRRPLAVLRDHCHLNAAGHFASAVCIVDFNLRLKLPADMSDLVLTDAGLPLPGANGILEPPSRERLRQLIIAKNRLWFDYWRPQNWAFLAGDRTAQPSSRDHLDPSKRWFPPEREAFLPLIDAKEKEIDTLAAQLATANAGK